MCSIIRNLVNDIDRLIDVMDLPWLCVCGVLVRSKLEQEVGI